MTLRRCLWLIIGVLAVCALLVSALIGYVLLRPARTPTTLLISDDSAGLRLERGPRGSAVVASDVRPAQYRFPAIAPDGKQVAYVGTQDGAGALFVHDLASGERRMLFANPNIEPFDLAWSPDSRNLLFLTTGPGALVLAIVPADGSSEPKPIAVGSSIYFAWNGDGSQLVLHVGSPDGQSGQVMLYKIGEDAPKAIETDVGFFQAPAFSQDNNTVFYVAQPPIKGSQLTYEELAATIVRVGVDGSAPKILATEQQAALRIVRSPTSDAIAYSVLHLAKDGAFTWGELKLVEEGKEPRVLSQPNQRVDAFFWSPDGTQIAYLTYGEAYDRSGPRTLNVVPVSGGAAREVASFTPSSSFADLNIFFDAYSYGFTPWSRDSRRLAFAASDGIYTAEASGGKPKKVGEGTFVLWGSE